MGICKGIQDCVLDSPADPDVAGIGVILSFGITALFNLVIILIAYIRGYLPQNRYKSADITFLKGLGLLNLRQRSHPIGKDEEKLIEDNENLLLSLSDQQLVTGLAIMVALYLKTCSVSVFSFQIAVSVAYFSCCIHISTLTVLRDYFEKHKLMCYIRIGAMIALVSALLASIVLSQSYTFNTNPDWHFACAFNGFTFFVSNQTRWLQVGNLAMTLWLIVSAYGAALTEMVDDNYKHVVGNWYFWLPLAVFPSKGKMSQQHDGLQHDGQQHDGQQRDGGQQHDGGQRQGGQQQDRETDRDGRSGAEKNKERVASVEGWRKEILQRMQESKTVYNQQELTLWGKLIIAPFILEEYSRSFLYKILWMLFFFTLGTSNFLLLWVQRGYLNQLEVWGFGQIVPMLLLAIPFLNFIEIIDQSRKIDKAKRKNQKPDVATSHPNTAQGATTVIDTHTAQNAPGPGSSAQDTPDAIHRAPDPMPAPEVEKKGESETITQHANDSSARCSDSRGDGAAVPAQVREELRKLPSPSPQTRRKSLHGRKESPGESQPLNKFGYESDNCLYDYLEEKEQSTVTQAVWAMVVFSFLALQFYGVLLGGVFNIQRIERPHMALETVALALGYAMALGHALLHLTRGIFFRLNGRPMYPPLWLLRNKQEQSKA